MPPAREPILTLEPLIDAVREGVESAGWTLSGLQKTTSHQFEGRWAGDSTRSAYLFFHHPDDRHPASVDVYLDETSRGLAGNLALVLDLYSLEEMGNVQAALGAFGRMAADTLPDGYKTPVTLRFRLRDGGDEPGGADTEIRFKLRIPGTALEAGGSAVAALASTAVQAFEDLLAHPALRQAMAAD